MLTKFKPITPGLRGTVLISKKELSREKPHKSLTKKFKSTGGRNNQGRITSRRMGGGVKRKYRVIDFKRSKTDIFAEVIRNEYDPNRSAFISLIKYEDGEHSYIISPKNIKIGDKIISGESVPIKNGGIALIYKFEVRNLIFSGNRCTHVWRLILLVFLLSFSLVIEARLSKNINEPIIPRNIT